MEQQKAIHPDWGKEQEHLTQTIFIVREERQKAEESLGIVDGNDRYIQVIDDGSDDALVAQFVTMTKLRGLHQLRLSERQPYFAHLDFMPDLNAPLPIGMKPETSNPIYIGRWGVIKTPEYKVCVVDWRSPVANLYYSGQVGRVSYEAPDGKVEGELTLKRMFSIADGKLESMQDTGLIGQEKFLTDALSQVTGARLREVVTTIQAEQNTVIRYDPMRPLCVQGVAGSGKTTIALHRIAWILYRLQKTIMPRQLMILAPNPLFLSYISRVLPDLGVNEVRQTTFAQLCAKMMGKRMPKLSEGVRLEQRLEMNKAARDELDAVLRRKGALSLYERLLGFLSRWEQSCIPKNDVLLGGQTLISAEELHRYFLTEFRHFPLQVRIGEVRKVVAKRLKKRMEAARDKLEQMVEERLNALLRAMPDGPGRRARAKKLFDSRDERLTQLKERQKTFLKEYDALWGSMDLLTVYAAFWQDMAASDPQFAPVAQATCPMLSKKRASSEDLPALMILAGGLYGFARLDVKHVVIDEAQDVSPLLIKALRMHLNHDAFTLVGDLCQGIYGDEGIRSWNDLSQGIFDQPPHIAHLATAYRSTVEITELALSIIARHPVEGIGESKPVLRHGDPPSSVAAANAAERARAVVKIVSGWLSEGFAGIAVIVKTAMAAHALYRAIADELPQARCVTPDDASFMGGVQVMDASVVKGLEFDCVLIADANPETYPDEPFYAKLMYVLCTRALHRLAFIRNEGC